MVGLRRSFWPMMGVQWTCDECPSGSGLIAIGSIPGASEHTTLQIHPETRRAPMASDRPAPRLDRHPLARCRAEPTPARWIAVLPLAATEQHGPHLPLETDVLIAQAYLARVRELLPLALARYLSAAAADRHFHRAYRLSRHADAAAGGRDRGTGWRSAKAWRAPGIRKLVMVTQPWRQQRGDDAGGAGAARPSRGMLVVTTSWVALRRAGGDCLPQRRSRHGIHGGAVETSIMLARCAASPCGTEQVADFRPGRHRHRAEASLCSRRSARSPLRLAGAGPASERRGSATPRKATAEKGRAPARPRRPRVLRVARRRRPVRSCGAGSSVNREVRHVSL